MISSGVSPRASFTAVTGPNGIMTVIPNGWQLKPCTATDYCAQADDPTDAARFLRLGATSAHPESPLVVQTAYGVTAEPESYDVTVNLIDRNGKPADDQSDVTFTPLFPTDDPDTPPVDNGTVKARLPKGAYGLTGIITTNESSGTIGSVPTLKVDHPGITVTFDARRANKIQAIVDASKATRYASDAMVQYTLKDDDEPRTISVGGGPDNDMYALPVRGDGRGFAFGYQTILTSPDR
ncbi:hypothetical protein ACFQ1S_37655, partial [Kibdelosporangium lantanae]